MKGHISLTSYLYAGTNVWTLCVLPIQRTTLFYILICLHMGGGWVMKYFQLETFFFFYQIGFVKHHFYGPAVSLQIKHV